MSDQSRPTGARVHIVEQPGSRTFSVWVPSGLMSGHSTLTSFADSPGVWWGRVGTERLPDDLEALPARSEERLLRVRAWQEERYAVAYAVINAAHPETLGGRHCMGEITLIAAVPQPAK